VQLLVLFLVIKLGRHGSRAAKKSLHFITKEFPLQREEGCFNFHVVCGLIREGEKNVFHSHSANMGFQIIYYTKVITVNFHLHENIVARAQSLQRGWIVQRVRKIDGFRTGKKITTSRKKPLHFFLNALEVDSNTVLKLFPNASGMAKTDFQF
jgi:hypothetical protein